MPAKSLTPQQIQELRSSNAAGLTLNEIAAQIGMSKRAVRYYCLDNHIPVPPEDDLDDEQDLEARSVAIACQEHLRDLLLHHRRFR